MLRSNFMDDENKLKYTMYKYLKFLISKIFKIHFNNYLQICYSYFLS